MTRPDIVIRTTTNNAMCASRATLPHTTTTREALETERQKDLDRERILSESLTTRRVCGEWAGGYRGEGCLMSKLIQTMPNRAQTIPTTRMPTKRGRKDRGTMRGSDYPTKNGVFCSRELWPGSLTGAFRRGCRSENS